MPSLRVPSRPSRWLPSPFSHQPSAFSLPISAFTLIELVSVLAIVCVLLTVALGAYISWTRAGSIDAGANQLAAALDHARELAITQRLNTQLVCSNLTVVGRPPRAAYAAQIWQSETNDAFVPAAPPGLLPSDVCLPAAAAAPIIITFFPDGTCDPTTNILVATSSSGRMLSDVVEVQAWRIRVIPREDQP